MVLFLGIGGGFCVWALPRLMRRVERWPVSAAVPSTVLVVTFVMAWAADYLGGVAAITGAFLVGLGLRRSPLHHTIVQAMHTIGYSLFVPLFFLSVGLHANLGGLDIRLLLFALAFILVAAVSKAVGGGLGSWLGGLSLPEAVRVGFGMISRGEVGLIVASVAIRERWFGEELLGVATLMVLTTTLMTPLLVKALFRRRSGGPKRPAGTESPVPDRARGGRRR